MGLTKPIEQILFSYQGTFIVSERYYTRGGNKVSEPILKVEHLNVVFHTKYGEASAVNDVCFSLKKG